MPRRDHVDGASHSRCGPDLHEAAAVIGLEQIVDVGLQVLSPVRKATRIVRPRRRDPTATRVDRIAAAPISRRPSATSCRVPAATSRSIVPPESSASASASPAPSRRSHRPSRRRASPRLRRRFRHARERARSPVSADLFGRPVRSRGSTMAGDAVGGAMATRCVPISARLAKLAVAGDEDADDAGRAVLADRRRDRLDAGAEQLRPSA